MSWRLGTRDLAQLGSVGITEPQATAQLERLARGTRYLELDRPAKLGDGIETLPPEQDAARQQAFERGLTRVTRFVPASGAASRMFADLLAHLSSGDGHATRDGRAFFDQPWPFQRALARTTQHAESETEALRSLLLANQQDRRGHEGVGLAKLPKALIPFHRCGVNERTALEEHIEEAVQLAQLGAASTGRVPSAQTVRLHFTVSPEHQAWIEALGNQTSQRLGSGTKIKIGTSTQSKSTDTLAIDNGHSPLREGADDDAKLVLRPGGHGALLHNLQECNADLAMIKNIDNVQPRSQRAATLQWKASLLGALVLAQDEIFELIEALERPTDAAVNRSTLLLARFGRRPTALDPKTLRKELNRPIRLCGVVRNEGEPGGGPFWVRSSDGEQSLQIVEGAQIDPEASEQQSILALSTHFNPVDIACGLRDHAGNPFDLAEYRDDETYFVAHKSHAGKPIRALEHPGLWNGAMAHWLTLFIEAPSATFTPVKTVWDLLRPEHQPLP